MIVRLDFECRAPAVAKVNYSGILTGRDNHSLAFCRQTLQVHARRFIGTMLRPHHGKDAKLDKSRLAAKQLFYTGEFFLGKIMGGDYVGCDRFHDYVGKSRSSEQRAQ